MSNPSGGPTLLAALVAEEHARLHEMLDEASIHTSTPGVREGLARNLADLVLSHCDAEGRVVEPAVRSMLGDDDARRMHRVADDLVGCVARRPPRRDGLDEWLRELRPLLDAHCRELDAQLLPALAERDADHMATLGYQFTQVQESTGQRR